MTTIKNIEPAFSVTDESIEQVQLHACKLLVELDATELSFTVLYNKTNRFLVFKSYSYDTVDALTEIVKADEFLKVKTYQQVVFSIVNAKSTLVPNAFYDAEKKTELLLFNHTVAHDESIATDDFRFFDAKNIFAVNDDLIHLIETNFAKAAIRHCSTPLIESLLLKHKNKNDAVVCANVHNKQFELVVLKNNQLLFYNAFDCATSEDFIYYIMFAYEQLELNPELVALEISGKTEKNSSYHTITKKYIRHVNFSTRYTDHQFSYGFENLPAHQYQTLFDLNLCVS